MSKPHGIIVFGANGSGKSTIARELANILNFKHMDIEDYHFENSEIPYTIERSHEDCLKLMLADISYIVSMLIMPFFWRTVRLGWMQEEISQVCMHNCH